MGSLKSTQVRWLAVLALLALTVSIFPPVAEGGTRIRATCQNGKPVILSRQPGTDYITVTCRKELPEHVIAPPPVPTYDPVMQPPPATPPDFDSWVMVWLNGRPLKTPFDPIRGVQEPGAYITTTGRVMMPVRFFTEAFGGAVSWNMDQKRALLSMPVAGGKRMELRIGSKEAVVFGQVRQMDAAPIIFLDRMFIPVRFLAETFAGLVEWDKANRSVRIEMTGINCVSSVYCGEAR